MNEAFHGMGKRCPSNTSTSAILLTHQDRKIIRPQTYS